MTQFLQKALCDKVWFSVKNHGLSPYENVDLLALLKTSIFWFKNYFVLSRISKHDLFWHSFRKKHSWEKVGFLDKHRGLSPYENDHFLTL